MRILLHDNLCSYNSLCLFLVFVSYFSLHQHSNSRHLSSNCVNHFMRFSMWHSHKKLISFFIIPFRLNRFYGEINRRQSNAAWYWLPLYKCMCLLGDVRTSGCFSHTKRQWIRSRNGIYIIICVSELIRFMFSEYCSHDFNSIMCLYNFWIMSST